MQGPSRVSDRPGPMAKRRFHHLPSIGVSLALLAVSIIPMAGSAEAPAIADDGAAVQPATTGKPQIGAWGFDVAGMDRTIGPGDNFYLYASGTWAKTTAIPPDKVGVDAFTTLEELSAQRVRGILEELGRDSGSKIGDFYASFMDRTHVNGLGHRPIDPLLAEIDKASSTAEVAALVGKLARMDINAPFWSWVAADDRDPDAAIINIHQAGLGMLERQYYLDKSSDLDTKRTAYRTYLARLLELTGGDAAEQRARAVLDFETKLASGHWRQVDTRDPDKAYNKLTLRQIKQASPDFPWEAYFHAAGYDGQSHFIIRQPDAIYDGAKLLATSPLPVVRDYLKLQLLHAYAPYLSQPFVDASFAFSGTIMRGTPRNSPDWKRGADLVSMKMGDDVGKIYVERHFPRQAKVEADRLVANILAAWDRRIQKLGWMTPATRARARAKLRAMVPEIGYPIRWRDYSTLAVQRDDLFGNVRRANEFEHQRQLNQLGKPVDKREWYTDLPAMGVNGYANHRTNQIVFSAGLLQPPFFDANADPAVNYGAIGAVIAHEIGHLFDDQGAKYDERGMLSTWWTPEDVSRFDGLTKALVRQYDRYEVFPGKYVSGQLTLGDNIGDLAGVTVAYDAYRHSLNGRQAPVRDGFTGDQRFFLGWAQIWRCNFRDDARMQALRTDVHAPPEQRTAVVRNEDGWYGAFGVRPGQSLYLPSNERVRIW